jgi:hypothetical protein
LVRIAKDSSHLDASSGVFSQLFID